MRLTEVLALEYEGQQGAAYLILLGALTVLHCGVLNVRQAWAAEDFPQDNVVLCPVLHDQCVNVLDWLFPVQVNSFSLPYATSQHGLSRHKSTSG